MLLLYEKQILKQEKSLQIKGTRLKNILGKELRCFESTNSTNSPGKREYGFVYDANTFEQLSSFQYGNAKEGWGLTHNAKELIKSDGTERLWFLDPATQEETHYIEAYTNKRKAESSE